MNILSKLSLVIATVLLPGAFAQPAGTVTNGTWKAKALFTGPLDSHITNPAVSRLPRPARWYAPDFDDSAWECATEYSAERVGPDGDFQNAKVI